ncbi:hypothetical protein [Bradyrhizobium icense]|uniref:hypothetical protein n=1 Tax=Bradyrhizobium icense TaxID=1274631 RepID=UPI0012E998D0|nr:hypothetical protein [Bradyrhizobium icense]
MATFVFSGDPEAKGTDPEECGMLGMTFPLNKPVCVDDERVAERLRRHSHFTEVKEEEPAEAKPRRGRPPKSETSEGGA